MSPNYNNTKNKVTFPTSLKYKRGRPCLQITIIYKKQGHLPYVGFVPTPPLLQDVSCMQLYVQCTVVAVLMLKFVRTRYVVNIYLAMQTNLCIDDYVTTFELLVVSLDLIG
jgi:hypothetical protein